MKLKIPEQKALRLLIECGGRISCDDPRVEAYSGDKDPDTWNRLFVRGLAAQWCVGPSEDDHVIRITELGRAALREDTDHG